MTENDGLRRYIEAATALTQITRSRAEELVRELIKAGELERHRAQDWVEELVKASRERSEALVATVRGEVRQQLKESGFTNVDVLARSSAAGRKVARRAAKNAKKSGPKKSGAKKSGAKKSAATKTAARKASGAKKAGVKKAVKKAGV